ncbi:FAD-binding protein [Flavobacterium sp. H122]|uniref:FAD-binding protein n=1 Tax=Flavobacterium sp. H122 TaxID=2529860 RepID=UPI0010AB248D|nr:FAD-binding protein [Flavobacterium sp. H122]
MLMTEQVLPKFEGKFSNEEDALAKVKTDFGQIITVNSVGCLNPKSTEDVQKLINYCNTNEIPVNTRGMSHSASGQCLADQGIVINIKTMNKILSIDFDGKTGSVVVEGGITWENLVRETLKVNATPPTLTDWQKLTVGGTISTGGLGFMSHNSGIQADNVLELEVVTGDGQIRICSRTENIDLFNLVRSGLGQFGVITKVKMKLNRAPKIMHVTKLLIDNAKEFHDLSTQLLKEPDFECIHAFLIPNTRVEFGKKMGQTVVTENSDYFAEKCKNEEEFTFFVELVQYEYEGQPFLKKELPLNGLKHNYQEDFFSYVTKEPPLIITEKEKGKTAHPELATFIPFSQFSGFMNEFQLMHKDEDMSDGPVLFIPMKSSSIQTPLFVKPEEDFYFIGILRNAYPNTRERVEYLSELNNKLYEIALKYGGNRYPCDSINKPGNPEEWAVHFGDQWQDMTAGKLKFDPKNTFRSMLNIFHN